MNNKKLVESTVDELTYASAILSMIINNNIQADGDLFNSIESVVSNIDRAKNNISDININMEVKPINEMEIFHDKSLEMVIGTVTTALEMAIDISVKSELGFSTKDKDSLLLNIIMQARLNLVYVYEKISLGG